MCKFDNEVSRDRKHVLGGITALARNGLIYESSEPVFMLTESEVCDGVCCPWAGFLYKEKIDYEYQVTVLDTNTNLLLPSPERAIVEYIQIRRRDEGLLIEALNSYILRNDDNNDKLYTTADYMGLDRSELDYWINEAINDEEV